MAHPEDVDTNRRDFLFVATGAMTAVATAAAVWPLISQMNPDRSVLSLASTEVDLAPIDVGQAITVMWRGKPVFIRHRTPAEIEQANAAPVEALPDPLAENANLSGAIPATDENRVIDGRTEWLVLIGVCTHLGCVPKGQSIGDARGEFGGWFCPCHGSHYDTAGRIRKGPAPKNLPVPPYEFVSDTRIRIG